MVLAVVDRTAACAARIRRLWTEITMSDIADPDFWWVPYDEWFQMRHDAGDVVSSRHQNTNMQFCMFQEKQRIPKINIYDPCEVLP